MKNITYKGKSFSCRNDETMLDAFIRGGASVSFSCKAGFCHVCMLRSIQGSIPEEAQKGLDPSLQEQGFFLPCKCEPRDDMIVVSAKDAALYAPATVRGKEWLAPDVCRLLLKPAIPLYYHAGQFVNLRREDGVIRSYSIASVPSQDTYVELHIKRVPGGELSNWICDELSVQDRVEIEGPHGDCYYSTDTLDTPILLLGTGTGLAPLIGVARDALVSGHRGPIHLYHGSISAEGLYLGEMLEWLDKTNENFSYVPCVAEAESDAAFRRGRVIDLALSDHPELEGWRVYVCGAPEMVHGARRSLEAAGVDPVRIRSDAFEIAYTRHEHPDEQAQTAAADSPEFREEDRIHPEPDPEMWDALGHGELLTTILKDFYDRVFKDSRLAPFFEGVTKDHVIGKQYSFLYEIFTGEDVYFGEWPRNAHHWMVISDELFDYRENLLEGCMRRAGLPEKFIKRWRLMEERFRVQMVKSHPWKKIAKGVEYPVEGYDETTLSMGSVCDGCQRHLEAGDVVRYHLRLGTIYCKECTSSTIKSSEAGMAGA